MNSNKMTVSVAKIVELLDLKSFNDIDLKSRKITCSDVNRPALQLTGYFNHFEQSRVQIIGNVEYAYTQGLTQAQRKENYDKFLSFDIPCVIFCRDLQPDPDFFEAANEHGVPLLGTGRSTSEFTAELI